MIFRDPFDCSGGCAMPERPAVALRRGRVRARQRLLQTAVRTAGDSRSGALHVRSRRRQSSAHHLTGAPLKFGFDIARARFTVTFFVI